MAYLSDRLRRAVRTCGKTPYRISHETGISASVLSRFLAGGAVNTTTADVLADYLQLELKPKHSRKGRGRRRKGS